LKDAQTPVNIKSVINYKNRNM